MVGTILLTGATGFIGSHLTRALVADGRDVTILCRRSSDTGRIGDILERVRRIDIDRGPLDKALSGVTVAGVVHLATEYSRRDARSADIFRANFLFPVELLDLAVTAGAGYFVNTDSFFCKPQFVYPHMPEYTYSKTCFLGWARKMAGRLHVANIQLEHVYGPQDGAAKFVSTILAQMLDPAVERINLTEGRQKRDFVFVDDVVDAYRLVIAAAGNAAPGYTHYEAGTGQSTDLRGFVECLHAETGSKADLAFGALHYRDGEIMDSRADLTALKALGYVPRTTMEQGIRRLVAAARKPNVITGNRASS